MTSADVVVVVRDGIAEIAYSRDPLLVVVADVDENSNIASVTIRQHGRETHHDYDKKNIEQWLDQLAMRWLMRSDEKYFAGAFLGYEDELTYDDKREEELYQKALQVAYDSLSLGTKIDYDTLPVKDKVIMRLAVDVAEARGVHKEE